ncbi:hypothetical protein ECG_05114 [Echinococcus granulosus]|uniref:Expressed conserved protein n=1 Tax=Echinococcus granulosus TaxID=6210 RepID=A0A068WX16_ECHGR|nr:hypothetical protein ECG_05114 [Echinococcus granulosus]CDS24704.1 expressed conserved protein [Echinococcus granulosus]
MVEKVLFLIFFFLCLGSNAQISSIKGDARIIRGPANSFFTLQAVLPDVYKAVMVGNQTFPIIGDDCTTSYFSCAYYQVRPYHALVTLAGKISKDLRWITFLPKRTYVIGVSIAVFPDDVWTPSIQDGLIPDPNKPFFIDALGMTSVKLTCTFSGIGTPAAIVATKYSSPVYNVSKGKATNYAADFAEIVELRVKQENTLTTYEITVEKRFRIDYIGCTDGVNWITYMIEWVRIPPASAPKPLVFSSVAICYLLTLVPAESWID